MYQRGYQILATVVEEIFISCRAEQVGLFEDYPKIIDAYDSFGPLTGLLSAFTKFPGRSFLVVPVDMPNLTSRFLSEKLVSQRNREKDATIIFDQKSSSVQPFPGIYESSSYPVISSLFSSKQYAVKQLLRQLKVHAVEYLDESRLLANYNTLEDWSENYE